MTKRWGLKRPEKWGPLPPPTKFDRLSDDDLYVAIEQALANATRELDMWRSDDPGLRDAHLATTETHLETALGALRAAMRRHRLRSSQ